MNNSVSFNFQKAAEKLPRKNSEGHLSERELLEAASRQFTKEESLLDKAKREYKVPKDFNITDAYFVKNVIKQGEDTYKGRVKDIGESKFMEDVVEYLKVELPKMSIEESIKIKDVFVKFRMLKNKLRESGITEEESFIIAQYKKFLKYAITQYEIDKYYAIKENQRKTA